MSIMFVWLYDVEELVYPTMSYHFTFSSHIFFVSLCSIILFYFFSDRQVLANELNIGYEDMSNQQIIKFNGVRIKNIHHLAHLIDSCKDKYLCFEFEDCYAAVLEREAVAAASSSLLRDYGIPSERSSDLLQPYVDSQEVEGDQPPDQEFGDSPVSNFEVGHDGLLWA